MTSRATTPIATSRLRRCMLAGGGFACVGLGGVGVIVPGLPTTIFLIAASWCFLRSSPELERRLIRDSRLFGPFVKYLQPGARMPLKAKLVSIALMWLFVGLSTWTMLGRAPEAAVAVTIALALVGTFFIARQGAGRSSRPVASEPAVERHTAHAQAERRDQRRRIRRAPSAGSAA